MSLLRVLIIVVVVLGAVWIIRTLILPAFPTRSGINSAERAKAEAEAELIQARISKEADELRQAARNLTQKESE